MSDARGDSSKAGPILPREKYWENNYVSGVGSVAGPDLTFRRSHILVLVDDAQFPGWQKSDE